MIAQVSPATGLAERLCAGLGSGAMPAGTAGLRLTHPHTHVLGPEASVEEARALLTGLGRRSDRVLILDWNGTHPDARAPELRRAWEVEETCRGSRAPVLVFRISPLVGPSSPLWLELGRARLGGLGRKLAMPVVETDVVRAIERAIAETGDGWPGWLEISGPDVMSLEELASLARSSAGGRARAAGAWEPSREVLAEQRLVEPAVWSARFGIEPTPIREAIAGWAA